MKKILILVSSIVLLATTISAQVAADKKVRFGLKATPTPTWLRSDDLKNTESSGVKFGFGFGLQLEFKISSTASFVTGIGGDFLGGSQKYNLGQGIALNKDNSAYVDSKDLDFNKATSAINNASTDINYYQLNSRSIKASYLTIPVLLKLMTKDISGFKYFGIFGGNIAVQTKFKAAENVTQLVFNTVTNTYDVAGVSTVSDMRPSGDIVPVNLALNVGIGAEYNLSGTTSLFISVNYVRGFISQYTATSSYIINDIKTNINYKGAITHSKQSAYSDGVQINVGILF